MAAGEKFLGGIWGTGNRIIEIRQNSQKLITCLFFNAIKLNAK